MDNKLRNTIKLLIDEMAKEEILPIIISYKDKENTNFEISDDNN